MQRDRIAPVLTTATNRGYMREAGLGPAVLGFGSPKVAPVTALAFASLVAGWQLPAGSMTGAWVACYACCEGAGSDSRSRYESSYEREKPMYSWIAVARHCWMKVRIMG